MEEGQEGDCSFRSCRKVVARLLGLVVGGKMAAGVFRSVDLGLANVTAGNEGADLRL